MSDELTEFTEWLRSKLIEQEGADPLGRAEEVVGEWLEHKASGNAEANSTVPQLDQVSVQLVHYLRELGREYGPIQVALVGIRLVGIEPIRQRLNRE